MKNREKITAFLERFEVPGNISWDNEDWMCYTDDPFDNETLGDIRSKWKGFIYGLEILESRIAELEEENQKFLSAWEILEEQNREAVELLGRSHNLSGEQQEQIDYDYDVDCFLNSIKGNQ